MTMNRDELIAKLSFRCAEHMAAGHNLNENIMGLIRKAYVLGTIWADMHPKVVWHDPEDEPKGCKDLLLISYNACAWVGYISHTKGSPGWKRYVQKGKVTKWAYVADLLPKGGEV